MRATILAIAVMALAFAQAQPERSKSMPADVGPGRVAWFDITTTNLAKAKEFYGKLFDWKFNPVQGTELAVEIVSRDAAIGTIRVAEGKISPFNGWSMFRWRSFRRAARRRANWVQHLFLASRSICRTGQEPSR
jgi:hypothetical protein